MYNIYFVDNPDTEVIDAFGEYYDVTDDISQANVLITCGNEIAGDMLSSKLIFAVLDCSGGKAPVPEDEIREHGIILFRVSGDTPAPAGISDAALCVRDYIENGNISGSEHLPDVSLGGFADDVSRISIVMKGIDDPILLSAMMFSGMDIRAVAGGVSGDLGYALVSSREPVTRVPHVDGVIKVRVLQDI